MQIPITIAIKAVIVPHPNKKYFTIDVVLSSFFIHKLLA